MDLGLGLAQLSPDERRALVRRWCRGYLVERLLERQPWWQVPFVERQLRVIECRFLAAMNGEFNID